MATCLRKSLKILLRDRHCVNSVIFGQVRGVIYSADHLDPTISKEELEQPLRDSDPRKYMKIKAAKTDESTFADYDPILNKFINMIMEHGDKKTARMILARTLENIKHIQVEKYHKADLETKPTIELDPVKVIHLAIENGKPLLTTEKIRKGGTTYQMPINDDVSKPIKLIEKTLKHFKWTKFIKSTVPVPCRPNVQVRKSMKWLVESGKKKDADVRMYDSLAREIVDAYNNKGKTIQKKLELHKLCESNKAYAHYRWS